MRADWRVAKARPMREVLRAGRETANSFNLIIRVKTGEGFGIVLFLPFAYAVAILLVNTEEDRDTRVRKLAWRVCQDTDGNIVTLVHGHFTSIPIHETAVIHEGVLGIMKDAPAQAVV